MGSTEFEIPKECKAGVVYNEGPDFELKVEMVPVPEPGVFSSECPRPGLESANYFSTRRSR
jgi:hypothetical protein